VALPALYLGNAFPTDWGENPFSSQGAQQKISAPIIILFFSSSKIGINPQKHRYHASTFKSYLVH